MKRLILAAIVAAFFLYGGYLAWRIAEERAAVVGKVDEILAGADAQELNLSHPRVVALLRVEDPTFWSNRGIDLSTPGAGLTTISQGLGKIVFFDGFEPGFAKLELMALTRFALYPKVDKRRTLQAAIAGAYFGTQRGRAVTGFADAARSWFGKPLDRLSQREYLSLIAMLVAPDQLKPGRDDGARDERVRRIELLLASQCQPTGLRDVMLDGCA